MIRHFNHSARYSDVVTDIEYEKDCAIDQPGGGAFAMKVQMKIDSNGETAPVIPLSILNGSDDISRCSVCNAFCCCKSNGKKYEAPPAEIKIDT
jgi:hypothetical protein